MGRSVTLRPPSIQRGTLAINSGATSASATVSAVDTARAQLRLLGFTHDGTAGSSTFASLVLTNSTTITATRASGASGGVVVSWELVEVFQ